MIRMALAVAVALSGGAGAAYAKGGTAKPPKVPPLPSFVVPAPPPVPPPVFSAVATDIHGFDATGFIQDAALSGARCPGLPRSQWGGTAVVDGITIAIPCNTILQMPAATLSWAEFLGALEPVALSSLATGRLRYRRPRSASSAMSSPASTSPGSFSSLSNPSTEGPGSSPGSTTQTA
jgi:hypothetical protein